MKKLNPCHLCHKHIKGNLVFHEKGLSQWLHWNGLSPVCVHWYICRLKFCEKCLSQRLHWNYFSSVWVILCITIKVVPEKALQQRLYWNGFSPVWVIWCFPRSKAFWRLNKRVLLEKSLSQWLHWWHTLERSQAISVNEIKLSQTVVIFTSIWWHTLERRISWVCTCVSVATI